MPAIGALAARRHITAATLPTRHLLPRMLAFVLLVMVFIAKGYVRVSPVHMSMALVVSTVLLAVLAQPIPGRAAIGRALLAACLVMSGYFTWLCFVADLARARANIAWAREDAATPAQATPQQLDSCRMPPGLERLDCIDVSADTYATLRYIQQRTSPGDPVFVGLSRHDKIFVNDVFLYFALNRPSATKRHHFDPGLQTSRPVQQEMIAELRRVQSKFIVIENRRDEVREPNESALSSGVTELDGYIRRSYRPAAQFHAYTVLVPIDKGDQN